MRLLVLYLLLVSTFFCSAQPVVLSRQDKYLDRWNHAIIALQSIQDPPARRADSLEQLRNSGKLSFEDYFDQMRVLENQSRVSWGTAIFAKYHDRHYLITARHVIEDKVNDTAQGVSGNLTLIENKAGIPNDSGTIVIDSLEQGQSAPGFYEKLDSGGIDTLYIRHSVLITEIRFLKKISNKQRKEYFLSSRADDIGIIYLDSIYHDGIPYGAEFVRTLYKREYFPVNITWFDTVCAFNRLDSVTCMGYPQEAAIWKDKQSNFKSIYSGSFKSWNIITKGFVYDNPINSNYFSASIFVYHGFSGGPVILNGRCIGLVSSFSFNDLRTSASTLNRDFVYDPKFIKSKLVFQYLKEFDSQIR